MERIGTEPFILSMPNHPRYEVRIFYSDEDEAFVANVPELRYCSAWGDSYEEALSEVLVAMDLHLETLREDGHPIPEPKARAAS